MSPRAALEPSRGTDADALMVLAFGLLCVSGGVVSGLLGSAPATPQPITAAHAVAMLIMPAFAAALFFRRQVETRASLRALLGSGDPLRDVVRGLCIGLASLPATLGLAYLTGMLLQWATGLPPEAQPVIESLRLPGTSKDLVSLAARSAPAGPGRPACAPHRRKVPTTAARHGRPGPRPLRPPGRTMVRPRKGDVPPLTAAVSCRQPPFTTASGNWKRSSPRAWASEGST